MNSPLVDQWDAPSGLVDAGGRLRGPVRVGAGEAAILYLLPSAFRVFRRQHPEIEIVLRHGPADQVLEDLLDGSLDFGIRSLPGPPPDFEFQPIYTCGRVLVASRGPAL